MKVLPRAAVAMLVAAPVALPTAPATAAQERAVVGRVDLARAFLRLDRDFTTVRKTLSPERLEEVNRTFDRSATHFLRLEYGEALRDIERARWLCLEHPPPWGELEALASLRMEMEMETGPTIGSRTALGVRLVSLFAAAHSTGCERVVTLRRGGTNEEQSVPVRFGLDGRVVASEPVLTFDEVDRWPGSLSLLGPGGTPLQTWSPEPRVELQQVFFAGPEEAARESPSLARALRIARARSRVLGDLGVDPAVVLGEGSSTTRVLFELGCIERGADPYHFHSGDLWRTVPYGRRDLPLRVFAPEELSADEPLPLVVAFHGAGAEESFFFEAGGQGLLVDLAREHRFLVAAPRTTDYVLDPRAFDALLDGLAADYPVDERRIYALGHSLGGMTVANLLKARSEPIAGAVCICGARELVSDVPTLVLAGALDPVVPAAGLATLARDAQERGLPVTYEEYPHHGHTMLLPDALERAVGWLGLAD